MDWKPQKSSGLLGWGIALLILGQIAYNVGQRQAIEAALSTGWSTPDDGTAWTVIGIIGTVVGLLCLIAGIVYLAQSVDYLARREHARSMIDSTADASGLSQEARDAAARGQEIIDSDDD